MFILYHLPISSSTRLEAEVFEDALAVHQLLGHDARNSEHGQTAILQLLSGEGVEGLWTGRLQAQRIEAKVAVHVAGLEVGEELSLLLTLLRGLPAEKDVLALDESNAEEDSDPEVGDQVIRLLELVDGRAGDLSFEKRVKALSDQDSNECQHADAAVLELSLAELLQVSLANALGETKGIEESHRRKSSDDSIRAHLKLLAAADSRWKMEG